MWMSLWLLALSLPAGSSETVRPAETIVVLVHADWNESTACEARLLRGFALSESSPADEAAAEAAAPAEPPARDAFRQFTRAELDLLIGDGSGDPRIRIGIKRAAEAFCQSVFQLDFPPDFPVLRGVEGLLDSSGTLPAEREEKLWVLVFDPRFRVAERGRRELESHLTVRLFRVQRALENGRWRLTRSELVFEDRSVGRPVAIPRAEGLAPDGVWTLVESVLADAAEAVGRSFRASGWSRLRGEHRAIGEMEAGR